MIPTSFDQSDEVLGAPRQAPEVEALSIGRVVVGYHPAVVSCWKLTAAELAEVNRTGRVWLTVMGETMPPVVLDGFSPYMREEP